MSCLSLIVNARLIEVFTYLGEFSFLCMLGTDVRIGDVGVVNVIIIEEVNLFITFIWRCTNFLVPKTLQVHVTPCVRSGRGPLLPTDLLVSIVGVCEYECRVSRPLGP